MPSEKNEKIEKAEKLIVPESKEECPKGFEVAPDDHVLQVGVDLLRPPERDRYYPYRLNREKESPPSGYEWVDIFGGNTVKKIIDAGYYLKAYRPIKKEVSKVEKTEKPEKAIPDGASKADKKDNTAEIKNEKCLHKNHRALGTWQSTKWCRDCGALWTDSGRKWVLPKKS